MSRIDSANSKVPADLVKAVNGSNAAKQSWDKLTPRCRQEWVEWIVDAKKDQTRQRRIGVMVEKLATEAMSRAVAN